MSNETAVILGEGCFEDELRGAAAAGGPRQEFIEIAKANRAQIFSFISSAARRGPWFRKLFQARPLLGSVMGFLPHRNRFSMIYTTGEDIAFPLALMLRLLGWRGQIITLVHNMTPRKHQILRRLGSKLFRAFIVVSERQVRELVEVSSIPRAKVFSTFVWVDDHLYTPADGPAPKRAQPRIVACGAENRDYALLLRVAREIDAQFHIYGHGFFGENAARLSRDDATPDNVTFMPRVSIDELAQAYREADVVVLPLNDVDYGAGVTNMMEALASGAPMVVTHTAGIGEYIAVIPNDCAVPPGDDAAMAKAIRNLLADPAERARQGAANRAWVEANSAMDRYVDFVTRLAQQHWSASTHDVRGHGADALPGDVSGAAGGVARRAGVGGAYLGMRSDQPSGFRD